jgi:hypothetical protein
MQIEGPTLQGDGGGWIPFAFGALEGAGKGDSKAMSGGLIVNETSHMTKQDQLSRLASTLSKRLAPCVPDEVSCCVFDCRRAECIEGDREHSTLRLDYAEGLPAAGRAQDHGRA